MEHHLSDGGYPSIKPITLIAHSMGGLISKTLITDSGDAVWNTVMNQPEASLRASPADRAAVHDILHWKARRDVACVIFVAIPHRGSGLSRGLIGRTGDLLAGLPPEFTSLYARLHQANLNALTPAFRRSLSRGRLTNIDTLSPTHPLLPVLNALPIPPRVTMHSIIGDRERSAPLWKSSDGVVPYTSSHWPPARTEVIVPAGHGAFRHPAALAAIKQILSR